MRVVSYVMINISSSNIFLTMILPARFHLCQPAFGPVAPKSIVSIYPGTPVSSTQGLSKDFHNRVSKMRIQELGCPKFLIEKVKIIALIMYITK